MTADPACASILGSERHFGGCFRQRSVLVALGTSLGNLCCCFQYPHGVNYLPHRSTNPLLPSLRLTAVNVIQQEVDLAEMELGSTLARHYKGVRCVLRCVWVALTSWVCDGLRVCDSWYTRARVYQESQNFVICDQLGKPFCDFVTGSAIFFVNHKHKKRYGTAPIPGNPHIGMGIDVISIPV